MTNPTSTAIFTALIALKTRNPIIVAFHPSAQQSSVAAAKVVRDAAVAAGAPEHCIQWVTQPSISATNELMNHPGVAMILAAGGNTMVKAAYSCGKPALGVGAGDEPAYIDKGAKPERAVNDVTLSRAFDNGMVCASEQAVVLDTEIYEPAMAEVEPLHAYRCTPTEKAQLEELVFGVTAESANCAGAKLNAAVAGMAFGNAFLGIVHAMAHTIGSTFALVHGRTNATLLPHVIRCNGTVPTTLTSWPTSEHDLAPERFAEIAAALGLPAATPEEGVESSAAAVERLRDAVGIEPSFAAQGIAEQAFISKLDDLAMSSYEDQCAPANPRMPMLDDMKDIMTAAHYGTSLQEVCGRRSASDDAGRPAKRARRADERRASGPGTSLPW